MRSLRLHSWARRLAARPAWATASGGALLTLGAEVLLRGDPVEAGRWLVTQPLAATLDLVLGALTGLAALALFGRVAWALGAWTTVLGVATLSHLLKLESLGRPLFPTDVFLFREGLAVLPSIGWSRWLLWLAPGLALLLAGLRLRRPRATPRQRLAVGAFVLLTLALLGPRPHERLKRLGVRHRTWVQAENYAQNGFLLAFTLNLGAATVSAPRGYDQAAVRAAMRVRPPAPPLPPREGPAPHIIVVMSESLFDPTRLPGVHFTKEPLPNLRRLQREGTSGTLLAPVFGGGTANTEFELLTGHTMHFLPAGAIAYQQYLRRKHPSLAGHLARAGYRTVALHSFHRWFWEREQVYERLGFERFVSMEGMEDLTIDGKYASDAVITRQILTELAAPDPRPRFIFAVTMEAHGPYDPHRYADQPTWLTADSRLDERARGELESYVTSVHHADRELGLLLEQLARSERPTWVFFFGDHLPGLRHTLTQAGVVRTLEQPTEAERRFLHQVPLVVWTNTSAAPRQLGTFSASFLGPVILELTGTPGSRYTEFLRGIRPELPALSAELPPSQQELARAWWLLEYDLLFGARYLLDERLER